MSRQRMVAAAVLGSVLILAALVALAGHYAVPADENEKREALIDAMGAARISLQQGLIASEGEGKPISGKFELEDGKLHLSVYAAKDGKFSEVLIGYVTGKIDKVNSITKPDDPAAAKLQVAAMNKAKIPLKDAIDKANREEFRAVSITPNVKNGRTTASVVLVKEQEFNTVEVPLE